MFFHKENLKEYDRWSKFQKDSHHYPNYPEQSKMRLEVDSIFHITIAQFFSFQMYVNFNNLNENKTFLI